jgi:hypothetical protein
MPPYYTSPLNKESVSSAIDRRGRVILYPYTRCLHLKLSYRWDANSSRYRGCVLKRKRCDVLVVKGEWVRLDLEKSRLDKEIRDT